MEHRDRRSPTAAGFIAELKTLHEGRAPQKCMHGFAQRAGAFSVHDANGKNSVRPTLGEIGGNQRTDVAGAEGVQVEFAGDGQRDGRFVGVHGVFWSKSIVLLIVLILILDPMIEYENEDDYENENDWLSDLRVKSAPSVFTVLEIGMLRRWRFGIARGRGCFRQRWIRRSLPGAAFSRGPGRFLHGALEFFLDAGGGFFEFADRLAEAARDPRQFFPAEKNQHHDHDQQNFGAAEIEKAGEVQGRAGHGVRMLCEK